MRRVDQTQFLSCMDPTEAWNIFYGFSIKDTIRMKQNTSKKACDTYVRNQLVIHFQLSLYFCKLLCMLIDYVETTNQ